MTSDLPPLIFRSKSEKGQCDGAIEITLTNTDRLKERQRRYLELKKITRVTSMLL
jgi:hypothetical protein